jgi:preprotein translocase subunit SecE
MNPVAFLQEVKAEMSKVVWPSRQQAIQLTVVVIVVSVLVGVYTGGIDYLFTNLVNMLITR